MPYRIVFFLFLGAILLAPLPFASNRPWSWSLLSLLVGCLLIAEFLTARESGTEARLFLRRMMPGLILWLAIALWIWLQSVPLPADLLAHPIWAETSRTLGREVSATISVDPQSTRTGLMRYLAYGGVFWLAARFCRDADNAALALRSFTYAAGLYAAYGLIVFFSGSETILWFPKWAYFGDLTSTFVNRNTFATFAGLGLLASVAMTFDLISRNLPMGLTRKQRAREILNWVFSTAWIPTLIIICMATALLLSNSRAGLFSSAVALFIFIGILFYANLVPRRIGLTFVALSIAAAAFTFTLSGDIVTARMQHASKDSSVRLKIYGRTIEAVKTRPLVGTGYGTFNRAFMAFKVPEISSNNWQRAHNSYLELAMEIGIPATVAVCAAFVWMFAVCVRGFFRRRRRKIYPALGIAATVLVAAHALVDFSLQIPGFTVVYALIMGMAWAQAWPTERRASSTAARGTYG